MNRECKSASRELQCYPGSHSATFENCQNPLINSQGLEAPRGIVGLFFGGVRASGSSGNTSLEVAA